MTIKIIHWNATSLLNKKLSLSQYLYNNNISIAAVQETFLSEDQSFFIKDFNFIRKDRNGRGGGVGLFIHNQLSFESLNIYNRNQSIEVIGCKILFDKINLIVLNFYIPPSSKYNKLDLQHILNSIQINSNDQLFICGDFNSHHVEFGSNKVDIKGNELLEFINSNGLVYLNDGSPTFFHPFGNSVLDISISSASLSLKANWLSTNESLGSSHSVILISINNIKLKNNNSKIVPSKIETEFLNSKVSDFFNSMNTQIYSPCEKFSKFIEFFNESFSKTVKPGKPINTNLWWTPECSLIQAKQRLALGRFKKNPSRVNFSKLQALKNRYKKILKEAKNEGWKKFCSNINPNISCGDLWRIVKSFKGSSYSKVSAKDPWLEEFCNNLRGPIGPFQIKVPKTYVNNDHFLLKEITYFESLHVLQGCNRRSSPGLDNIRYTHLSSLNKNNIENITALFNSIMNSSSIPESWNIFQIVPITKKGVNPNLSSSKRPIAKGSCIRKWFEGILKNRLEWYLECRGELSPCQSGFRRGKSTTDNILALWSDVQVAFHAGSYVASIFLDIKGAFDNVNIDILYSILIKMNIPERFCCIIYNLFSNKKLIIKTDNSNIEFYSYTGLSQGTILAPLLFDIYINFIFKNIANNVSSLAYADDICLYTSNRNPIQAFSELQIATSNVNSELQKLNLTLAPSKCKTLLFTKRRSNNIMLPSIVINGQIIENLESFCFLGFYFDCKLTYKTHINFISKKCNNFMNILRALCGVSWGAHPYSIIQVYKGAIRPKIDYASPFYNDASQALLLKLDRIQWKACRIALGAMISTHTLALEVESKVPPLKCRRKYISNCMISKIISYKKEPALEKLSNLNNYFNYSIIIESFKFLINLNIMKFQKHPWFTLENFEALFFKPKISFLEVNKKQATEEEIKKLFDEFIATLVDFKLIYTDGSKNKDGTCFAFCFPYLNVEASFRCSSTSSIYTAEALAIRESLLFIKDMNIRNSKFLIISDSKSCLTALNNNVKSETNYCILQTLDILFDLFKNEISVEFLWIPSHMGVNGNENVDKLANSRHKIESVDFPDTMVTDLKPVFKLEILNKWQLLWNESPYGRDLYALNPIVNKSCWFKDIAKPRYFITLFNRLRFTHCCALTHLKKVNISDSDLCECGLVQTVDHILFNCTNVNGYERAKFLRKLYQRNVFYLNINEILKKQDLIVFQIIFDFLTFVNIKL